MKLNIYQIDAFTDTVFKGNPACVVPLEKWLPDEILLEIAKENAVAETAFFIDKKNFIQLRWFTPEIEMDLCGHATLATAHCLKTIQNYPQDKITFKTLSGELTVLVENNLYTLNFPSRVPEDSELPDTLRKSLNIQPKKVLKSRDYVLVYDTEEEIKNIEINRTFFDQINLNTGGVIVTAKGEECDFVSRFFTPQASILEDMVTGSAHCSLIPYWSKRLKKEKLIARQISPRGGTLICQNNNKSVLISGKAVTYSIGSLWIQ